MDMGPALVAKWEHQKTGKGANFKEKTESERKLRERIGLQEGRRFKKTGPFNIRKEKPNLEDKEDGLRAGQEAGEGEDGDAGSKKHFTSP
uniref:BUD22 domain-containing protein n=1 Tax=Ascaris lumbricoides TaxID=6252 RepID=A0A0M3I4C3_ASCLU